ncbi:MAG: O-antigen ligase family protein [Rhodospirillales bacterium]|nr:O-antigen ligase family protein [Rhodospirillales bacterium]
MNEKTLSLSIAILWLAGFFLSLPLVEPYEAARFGAVACTGLAAVLGLGGAGKEQTRLFLSPLMIVAGVFWLLCLASIFWAPSLLVSTIAFGTFSLLPLSVIALVTAPPGARRIIALGGGMILAGLSLWALVQFFFLPDYLVRGEVRHPFQNPNSYAALLGLGLFPAMAVMMGAPRKEERSAGLGLAALLVAALIVIASRGVFLALVPMLGLFLFMARTHLARHKRCLGALLIVGFLFTGLSQWQSPKSKSLLTEIPQIFAAEEKSRAARIDIWRATGDIIKERPLSGTGIGSFFLYYPEVRRPAEIYSGGYMAHSDPLQFWSEMGMMAPALFYAFLLFAGWRMIKARPKNTESRPEPLYPAALFCALGSMIAHSHISFDLYSPPILALAGGMLGTWLQLTEPKSEDHPAPLPVRAFSTAKATALLVPLCILLFALQGFLTSNYLVEKGKIYLQRGQTEKFSDAINRANSAGFYKNARAYTQAAAVPLTILEEKGAHMSPLERQSLSDQAEKLLQRAEENNPQLVTTYYYRARLQKITGHDGEALKTASHALALTPMHLPSRMLVAHLNLQQDQKEKALEILRAGLHWPVAAYDPVPYYQTTATLATELGDPKTTNAALIKLSQSLKNK